MEIASTMVATLSAVISIVTYVNTSQFEKRKITIEAVNLLQNEVLDKFVAINKKNAKIIVENLDNEKCREAYNDYRTLIARVDHFAVAVNKRIYNLRIVNILVGKHIIYLYEKVIPIINEANKNEKSNRNYCNFEKLVKKLNRKHKIIKIKRI